MRRIIFILLVALGLNSCHNSNNTPVNNDPTADVPFIEYTTVKTFPHDTSSFTEGLMVHNNQLFESTGSPEELKETRSVFGPVDIKTGKIEIKGELDRKIYFGEDIIFFNKKIYQLTYKNQVCFVYDASTYKKIGQYNYPNKEGWGLTTDSTYIIMSDGTNVLSYVDPSNFKIVKTLKVTSNNYALENINELEFIKGYIYANVWYGDEIVKIDTATGHVVGKLDLSLLKQQALGKHAASLETNGIAYDPATDKIYVTGKMWPYIFQIDFKH
jgi:glutaminyl-peptide cyclotransferase